MSTSSTFLPKEVTALVHHIELNKAGWWDKTVHRLVLSAIWMAGSPQSFDEIQIALYNTFRLRLSVTKLLDAIMTLESQGLLIAIDNDLYRIPDQQRLVFEAEIKAAEKVERDTYLFFSRLTSMLSLELDPKAVWDVFEKVFLGPLIREVGANAYHLIAGESLSADKGLLHRFLTQFPEENHPKLSELVTKFLDPKNEDVRKYIIRLLHARFCIDASGLPESALQKLNEAIGKQINFRIFVDTNFLFSLLALHENPSNTSAQELRQVILQLNNNPCIELFVTPRTIDEAKHSIAITKVHLSEIPSGINFTRAALNANFSGMVQRFLIERSNRKGNLSAAEWLDPYLNDFVIIAQEKGVRLFDDNLDSYAVRQDVINDIHYIMDYEERKHPEYRRKNYEMLSHDMILWHFVDDRRSKYTESPIDVQDWLLTVDFRLLGFDAYVQEKLKRRVPVCLHPTSLIQLLQFWVPRSKEFEEAILGSMRLPFLFQEFDTTAERTTLRILKGIGRFEHSNELSEASITRILFNEGLRSRLRHKLPEDEEIALIRDALLAEMKLRADAEAQNAKMLNDEVQKKQAALATLEADHKAKDDEFGKLLTRFGEKDAAVIAANEKIASQGLEINDLKSKWSKMEESKNQRVALIHYFGFVAIILLFSALTGWGVEKLSPWCTSVFGAIPMSVTGAVVAFSLGHLILEWWHRDNAQIIQLWHFKLMQRFRRWLWGLLITGVIFGVGVSLYSTKVQDNLNKQSPPLTLPNNGTAGTQKPAP